MNTFYSKYKVLEKIGEGSFSEVIKCECKKTNTYFAAKRLKKIYKTESSIWSCAELIAARKIPGHPNILNMLESHYDTFAGKVVFIFELMDMSMHDYLKTKRRGLSEHRVRNYLYQMLKGLEHLHKHGLFHRDVKPENILIKFPSILYAPLSQANNNEIIKLADLGSVRGIFSAPPYTEYISTRWYRSPECLLTAGNYGPKMDVWATGCVFYEMLTLRPLFPGSNEIDQLCKIHQVLGSPSIQYLSRLKSKSRNCIFFPKIHGTGLDTLLPYLTRDGRNVLRLMVEYDSDKRINVKRLLRNCYFDDLRDSSDGVPQKLPQLRSGKSQKSSSETNKRSMGDDGTVLSSSTMIKKKVPKREHYPDELHKSSKESTNSCHSNKKSDSSIKSLNVPAIEVPYYAQKKPINISRINRNNFKVSSLPLVDFKVKNSIEQISSDRTSTDGKIRVLRSRPVKKNGVGRILKMSSNLESIGGKLDLKSDPKKLNQFHSKSLILPRQLGQHRLEAVNEKKPAGETKISRIKLYREERHT